VIKFKVRKTLNFKKEYREAILSGRKTCTIRLKTNLKVGDEAYLVVGGEKLGVIRITAVNRKRIAELTNRDARRDGFRDVKELIKALKRHYKKIRLTTMVSIIHFRFIRDPGQ